MAGRLSDRWSRLSMRTRWTIGFVLWLVFYGVFRVVADGQGWIFWLGIGILCAALFGIGWLQGEHRLGGPEQRRLYRGALKTGQVPPDADREKWRPFVFKARRRLDEVRRINRIMMPVTNGALLLLAVGAGIAVGGKAWLLVLFPAVLGAAGYGSWRVSRWQLKRLSRLEKALEGDPA